MASPSREERPRVTGQRHQDHYDHLQLKRRSGPAATQPYPLQKPSVLSHTVSETRNHVLSQGDNSAARSEESSFADIYTVKETDAQVGGSELLPLPATLCRETIVEVSDTSEGADCRTTTGAPSLGSFFPEVGIHPFSSALRHINERPVHHWHPQSPMVSEQRGFDGASHHLHLQRRQRRGGLVVDCFWNAQNVAGHDYGGGVRVYRGGGDGSANGGHRMGADSPASSVSSDGSVAGLVGNSPTAVWEVETYGVVSSKDGAGSGRRKRPPVDADRETTAPCNRDQSTDDLKNVFPCATVELESSRTSATEEIKKEKHNIGLLLQLLRQTRSERDEAREHLQRLLDEITQRRPSSRLHHLASSSLLESLLGSVSSPVDSGSAAAAQPTLPGEPSGPTLGTARIDAVSAVIDRLAMNRPLPEKGKLLQAVVEAGPLLQTLLVTGPLPRWRNPPPLQQFLVPPVSISGRESASPNQKATFDRNHLVQSCPQAPRRQNPQAASQIYAASPLDFSSLRALCVRVPTLLPACVGTHDREDAIGKRQKL